MMKFSKYVVTSTIAAAIAVVGLGGPAAAQTQAWTMSVSPSTDLAAEQTVTVTASGLDANRQILLLECPTADGSCYIIGYPTADANGDVSTTATVYRHMSFDDRTYDCKTLSGGCSVVGTDFSTGGELVKVPLTFQQ
ncbi:neocarzinostatin apoprotein domain-containing protein [Amycolatopsis sp. NPDC102389]|uniref:neocarzinostatin apoprotein domain-containing protein n=1 Tax=Amycolatopsis sp. NPDC102389 TaxID=3363941 RepID=UPI003829E12E